MMLPLKKADEGESPLWLIIFSDMSTNLMMFFLMLFAMTRMSSMEIQLLVEGMQKAMQNEPPVKLMVEKDRQEDTAVTILSDAIAYGKLKSYATLEVTDDQIKVTLDMPFLFASGSAEIDPQAEDALSKLAAPFNEFPSEIIVEGHTDNVPIKGGRYLSNWELSVARAVRVIEFLVSKGMSPDKLVAGGYGEYHPSVPNDSAENRALNRRIEITIPRHRGASG